MRRSPTCASSRSSTSQLRHHDRELADAGESHPGDLQGVARRRGFRHHLRHQHARGDRVFPEPDGAIGQARRPGRLDAAGDGDQRRRPVEPAQCRADGDCAGCEGKGALIVLNDEINAARDTTKTNTLRVETFRAPELGARLRRRRQGQLLPIDDQAAHREFRVRRHVADDAAEGDDPLSYVEPDATLIQAAIKAGAKGIVFAGTGNGALSVFEETVLKEIELDAGRVAAGAGAIEPRRQRPRDADRRIRRAASSRATR